MSWFIKPGKHNELDALVDGFGSSEDGSFLEPTDLYSQLARSMQGRLFGAETMFGTNHKFGVHLLGCRLASEKSAQRLPRGNRAEC